MGGRRLISRCRLVAFIAVEGMVDDGSVRPGVGMHPNMMHPGMMPPYYGMPMYGGYGAQPGMYGYNKQSQMQSE